MANDYIKFSDFQKLCFTEGINDSASQNTLLDFLHDLGIVLHFKDLALRDTNVINPRWITDGVYKIINERLISDSDGTMDFKQLENILNMDTHPPDKHNFIIELMKKFELCYQISSQTILIPSLLPIEEPDISFPNENNIYFYIDYDFFPKSIIPRFIVRSHNDIENNLCWRTGVVLKNETFSSKALIRADEVENRIELRVVGDQRRYYLGVILHFFREINESFEKLII